MKSILLIATLFAIFLPSQFAHAFGVDVCFNDPASGQAPIRNCIGVEEVCRTSNLDATQQLQCRVAATADSLSGLSGSNAIIGGRSLLHSDSTYLMAQLIGYRPWQAYQLMIYNEATDQSDYFPFDQNGAQMLSDADIAECRAQWGRTMPRHCLVITRIMNGVYKFNDTSGGMLLHLHARYSQTQESPPAIGFPADYLSAENVLHEPLLGNLHDWVFGARSDACVGGVLATLPEPSGIPSPCELRQKVLSSPQSFFAAGVTRLQIPFESSLGRLVINQDDAGTVLATDPGLQRFVGPHAMRFAKAGIFLHALADRSSHHTCTDRSWFYRLPNGNYTSKYDAVACGQGSHFLWHAWEQGADQSDANLAPEHRTMRPALSDVYDQLLDYATALRIPVRADLDKAAIIDRLILVLQTYDPQQRLDAMVRLMQDYSALPLPGHGSSATLTIEQWLDAAGAPRLQ
jgi:hypothetical protein